MPFLAFYTSPLCVGFLRATNILSMVVVLVFAMVMVRRLSSHIVGLLGRISYTAVSRCNMLALLRAATGTSRDPSERQIQRIMDALRIERAKTLAHWLTPMLITERLAAIWQIL